MKKIQMVDLYSQYFKIKEEIDDAISQVINNSNFIKGPEVKLFEQELAEYLKVKHVISCANGTDALQVALMALDLEPGDEVISPDFTFISTVEVSAVLRLTPVLVDVHNQYYTLSPEAFKDAVTDKTKVVVPVHLYGQCAQMKEILEIASANNIKVIEDNAQAIGASYMLGDHYTKSGTLGDIGCTSFFPSKNLGCFGDGGSISTNNDELAEKIRAIANHGMKVKYYNDYVGINSRLDTLQAAILRVKLKKLDTYNQSRQRAAQFYDEALSNIGQVETPFRNKASSHVFHQYTVKLSQDVDRDDLKEYLLEKGIPTMIYYPVPMHKQNAYKYLDINDTDFTVTNDIVKRVISLPMHTELDDEQLDYITKNLIRYFN